MAERYMKKTIAVLSIITVAIIASQLTGCKMLTQDELVAEVNESSSVVVEVVEPGTQQVEELGSPETQTVEDYINSVIASEVGDAGQEVEEITLEEEIKLFEKVYGMANNSELNDDINFELDLLIDNANSMYTDKEFLEGYEDRYTEWREDKIEASKLSEEEEQKVFSRVYENNKNICKSFEDIGIEISTDERIDKELTSMKSIVQIMYKGKILSVGYEDRYRAWRLEQESFKTVNENVYAIYNNINIRSKANTSSDIKGQLNRRDIVTRIGIGQGEFKDWSKVKLDDGSTAYVMSEYISTKDPGDPDDKDPKGPGGPPSGGGSSIGETTSSTKPSNTTKSNNNTGNKKDTSINNKDVKTNDNNSNVFDIENQERPDWMVPEGEGGLVRIDGQGKSGSGNYSDRCIIN